MYKDGVGRKWDGGSGISLESRLFFRSGLKVVYWFSYFVFLQVLESFFI